MKNSLYKIRANINLVEHGGRNIPIKSGYRPGFVFVDDKQTSGSITLTDCCELYPGTSGNVEILFHSKQLLGDFKIGDYFKFFEGNILIGSGKISSIVGWIDNK